MPQYLITASDRGKTLELAGTLTSLTYAETPDRRVDSYHLNFTLLDQNGVQLFSMQPSSQPIPQGTVLSMHDHPFSSLTVADIPGGGCSFLADYEGPEIEPEPPPERDPARHKRR
jgi:hypothetical protein